MGTLEAKSSRNRKQCRLSNASLFQIPLTEALLDVRRSRQLKTKGDICGLPLAMDMVDDAEFLNFSPSHPTGWVLANTGR
jgi:hypothetical protein